MVRVPRRWLLPVVVCSVWVGSAVAGPAQDAAEAYQQGDYSLAVDLYEQAADTAPGLLDDAQFVSAYRQAEARVAYAAGARLHEEGEYGAAADQFMLAIAKDSNYELAYAALEDAQRAGVRKHFIEALTAADRGDLLEAKHQLEASLVLGGAGDEQVTRALTSIAEPDKAFDKAALNKLAEAQRLGKDRQWGLAERQLTALVGEAPLLLPARAELYRAGRIKTMSITMTDEAAALIAQGRLSPALAKLSGAANVWPYNTRAAELLESVEAQVKRAQTLVDEARALADAKDWRGANEKVAEALKTDASHAGARTLRSQVRVGMVTMLSDQALAELEAGDTARARALLDRGNQFWPNNRFTRRALSSYHLALSEHATEAGHTGAAYLRAVLAARDIASAHQRMDRMERAMVSDAGATYAYDIKASNPSIGVDSTTLTDALTAQAYSERTKPATCVGLLHPGRMIETEVDSAGFRVDIRITDTDIDLRQRNNGFNSYSGTSLGGVGNVTAAGSRHYWEKYGTVEAAVSIVDTQTGREVESWTASRWANYTDRRQYVIGTTWNTTYWTLPTDAEIANRLARDLAAQIQPSIEETVTLAQARSLRDEADAIAEEDPAGALTHRVAAVVLAGQINPRQARHELRRMAKDLDEAQPHGGLQTAE